MKKLTKIQENFIIKFIIPIFNYHMCMKHIEKQDNVVYVKMYIKDTQIASESHLLFITNYIKYINGSHVV